jgi:hypothetical protein
MDAGQRAVVERFLRERMALPGICCAVGVRMRWRMACMVARLRAAPEDWHVQLPSRPGAVIWRCMEAEADAMPSVGQTKAPAQGLGLARATPTRQSGAWPVGERRRQRARRLWAPLPAVSREQATL